MSISFPPLGDPQKTYEVTLTEPEINAIHAFSGHVRGYLNEVQHITKDGRGLSPENQIVLKWFSHYGPTLESLSKRLKVFDDGNSPRNRRNT